MGLFNSINPLVKVAKSVINNVRGQLTQQTNLLDTAVKVPIQAMVKEVTGGIWIGDGADAFVEQCTKLFIPGTEGITSTVRTMNTGIGKALEIMETADSKSLNMVNDLDSAFRAIYK